MAYAPAPATGWPGPAYGSSSYAGGGSYAPYGASTGYAGYYGAYDPSAAAYYQQQPGQGYAAGGGVAPPLPPHAQGSAAGTSAPPAPPSSPPPPPPPGGEAAPGTAEDNSSASDKSTTTGAAAAPAPPSSSAAPAQPAAAGSSAVQPGQPPPGYDPVAYQQYYASYQAGVAAAGYNPASGYNASGYNASGYPGYNAYNQYPQQPYPGMQQQQPYPGVQQPYAGYGAPGGVRPDSSYTPTPTGQAGQQAHASRQERQGNAAAASAGGSYNAVPPPASVGVTGSNRIPISIRPQMGKSFAAAAATGTTHSNATPAYVRVGGSNTSNLAAQRSQSLSSPSPTGASAGATAAPKPAAAKPAAAAGAGSGKFPPTFSAWVERCFERCRADTERAAMTAALTKRITAVEKAGRMWLVDWDKEPYPTLTDPAPSPSAGADRHGYGAATGLRAKRSRWEESAEAAPVAAPAGRNGKQQQQLQQPLSKKQRKALARQQAQASEPTLSYAEQLKLRQRAGRFGDGSAVAGGRRRRYDDYDDDVDMDAASDDSDVAFDASSVVIVGTSTQLEKSYFRLTGPPNPAEVRPAPVLRQALDRLVGLLRKGAVNWFYTCDQFKGLRQDCTVQHLRNELAVAVYEAHARAALEYGDLAEFNQCQTQLASMYADGVPGCVGEFTAYKLLYHTVHASSSAKPALLHTLRAALAYQQQAASRAAGRTGSTPGPASSTQLGDAAVANALRARTAFFADNVSEFFKAYAAAPALGRALLDALAPHVRWAALNSVVKAYKTSVPVSFLAHMLGFVACSSAADAMPASGAGARADATPLPGCRQAVCVGKAAGEATEEAGVAACVRWLQSHGAVLEAADSSSPLLDVKSSLGKLVIPEPPKVAHGDENLSLGDFLARASGLQA